MAEKEMVKCPKCGVLVEKGTEPSAPFLFCYRVLHSLGETPLSFLKARQNEEKLLKPTA